MGGLRTLVRRSMVVAGFVHGSAAVAVTGSIGSSADRSLVEVADWRRSSGSGSNSLVLRVDSADLDERRLRKLQTVISKDSRSWQQQCRKGQLTAGSVVVEYRILHLGSFDRLRHIDYHIHDSVQQPI